MNEMVSLKLSTQQANLLLQSALFSCSADITSEWTAEELQELVTISKYIESKVDDLDLGSIQAYTYRECDGGDKPLFADSWTQDILEHFGKNLKVVDLSSEMCNN